jgi:phenylpyruvate tautomerase PptA (4-oxalocrotonate tautomerase family)
MPMIELTYPQGALDAEAKETLVDELATKLLSREGAPDTDFFRSITWVYVNEVPAGSLAVGGRDTDAEPRFRVQVTVPEGALSERRKAGLVADVHEVVSAAAGLGEAESLHVWTLIRDVPEGNWGAAGQLVRFQQLAEAAKSEREDAEEPVAAST